MLVHACDYNVHLNEDFLAAIYNARWDGKNQEKNGKLYTREGVGMEAVASFVLHDMQRQAGAPKLAVEFL
jgi:hypothetical protein